MAFIAYAVALLFLLFIIYRLQKEVHRRQNIIEGQQELLMKQRVLIEEKMTEKVKQAFEKPKRPRKNV